MQPVTTPSPHVPVIRDEEYYKGLKARLVLAENASPHFAAPLVRNSIIAAILNELKMRQPLVNTRGMGHVFYAVCQYVIGFKSGKKMTVEPQVVLELSKKICSNTAEEARGEGAAHKDMESVIDNFLASITADFVKVEIDKLKAKSWYYYRGKGWDDPIVRDPYSHEIILLLTATEDEFGTSIEGGHFLVTASFRTAFDKWDRSMFEKLKAEPFSTDVNGWYVREFNLRSVFVYSGILVALIVSLVATIADLGDEGANVFKRINFFATLMVSMDLVIVGILKTVDRNDKVIIDSLTFKRRVSRIKIVFKREAYSEWRKLLAYDATSWREVVSPQNACYASVELTGSVVTEDKMTAEEAKECFYLMQGVEDDKQLLVNRKTGRQYVIDARGDATHITRDPNDGLSYTNRMREIICDDNIKKLG